MASEVDICNLALAHLGDTATVSSIDPPEGSPQAEHCARFYPLARDALLEMHSWNFSTRRVALAKLTNSWSQWDYCYALPNDLVAAISVLPPDGNDDYSSGSSIYSGSMNPMVVGGVYQPQAYTIEILPNGTRVLYTDQADAVLRYTAYVRDTSQFSPTFLVALSWLLASYMAGPVIKGDAGSAEAKRCLQMFGSVYARATMTDSNQHKHKVAHNVPWIGAR